MMWQCRFIHCNKCATLAGDVNNKGGFACVGTGSIWELLVPSAQFRCEPKSALKIQSVLKKYIESSKRKWVFLETMLAPSLE